MDLRRLEDRMDWNENHHKPLIGDGRLSRTEQKQVELGEWPDTRSPEQRGVEEDPRWGDEEDDEADVDDPDDCDIDY